MRVAAIITALAATNDVSVLLVTAGAYRTGDSPRVPDAMRRVVASADVMWAFQT